MGAMFSSFIVTGVGFLHAWCADHCFKQGKKVRGLYFSGLALLCLCGLVALAVS